MRAIKTTAAPAAVGPYTPAYITGDLVFTAGQIPLAAESGDVFGTNITEQTEQVAKNLRAILEAAGSSMEKIVKTTCYLTDADDFSAFNEIYSKHFPGKPARTTVFVQQLPRNVLVEIDAIAELR